MSDRGLNECTHWHRVRVMLTQRQPFPLRQAVNVIQYPRHACGLRRAAAFQEGTADVAVKASSAYAVLP
ncbi:hypothetical protein [Zymobacter sp. IVIA_12111.31 C1]|uniref:hypothetical protein n=1 Tax=Zymobacter sp. IVIA_12111.31 C1 TaxID=3394854 RepID=UPI0039C490FE